MKHISSRYNNYEFDFGRVNVILGANGAGKSTFLQDLKGHIATILPGAKAVYIEGGRTIKITDVLQLDHRNVQQYDLICTSNSRHFTKHCSSIQNSLG
jgi:ABC-type hemin transport system ATPase subunit